MIASVLMSACIILSALATPDVAHLDFRDADPPPDTAESPTINATILDHNGTDITSSFRIMVYQDPPIHAASNLTDRQATLSRPANKCWPGTTFWSSQCTPRSAVAGSLQSYVIWCQYPSESQPHRIRRLGSRSRHCQDNEICVNGRQGPPGYTRPRASCVATDYFVRMLQRGDNGPLSDIFEMEKNKHPGWMRLEGMLASAVLSKSDSRTPLEVDSMSIVAGGTTADGGTAGQGGQCRDCLDLETAQFAEGTSSLKVDTTVLTAGAVGGILWLGLMAAG